MWSPSDINNMTAATRWMVPRSAKRPSQKSNGRTHGDSGNFNANPVTTRTGKLMIVSQ